MIVEWRNQSITLFSLYLQLIPACETNSRVWDVFYWTAEDFWALSVLCNVYLLYKMAATPKIDLAFPALNLKCLNAKFSSSGMAITVNKIMNLKAFLN